MLRSLWLSLILKSMHKNIINLVRTYKKERKHFFREIVVFIKWNLTNWVFLFIYKLCISTIKYSSSIYNRLFRSHILSNKKIFVIENSVTRKRIRISLSHILFQLSCWKTISSIPQHRHHVDGLISKLLSLMIFNPDWPSLKR